MIVLLLKTLNDKESNQFCATVYLLKRKRNEKKEIEIHY